MYFASPLYAPVRKTISLLSVILLVGCDCQDYYKICADDCIMRGSALGNVYDPTCSDNVTFMVAHWADGELKPGEYQRDFNNTVPLTLYQNAEIPVAMHSPIFPDFQSAGAGAILAAAGPGAPIGDAPSISEPVTFSLNGNLKDAISIDLYISVTYATPSAGSAMPLDFNPYVRYANWKKAAEGPGFDRVEYFPTRATRNVNEVTHQRTFRKPADLAKEITFITYRFIYRLQGQSPEKIEITFALQDYSLDLPVPVYVQANPNDVVDVLFVPANDHNNQPPAEAFHRDFNRNCQSIISDHIFKDPTVRYWRKNLNFWLSRKAGQALDYNRFEGHCHTTAETIPDFINVAGLLHDAENQRDYSCDRVFSAYMKDGKKVLHELGHSAFKLEDEYRSPGNHEETELHFPNNWAARENAARDANLRHKTAAHVRKIRF